LSPQEILRETSLMGLAGSGERALDIGVRDGYYSSLLLRRYRHVTALDLERPNVPGCENVAGDVRHLQFADRSFDLVFCAEVLEHVPGPEGAAREIARVSCGRVLIGVPYKQDIRVGRVTCQECGRAAPPWGHINRFDEGRLQRMFPEMRLERIEFVGPRHASVTSAVAAWLMDRAGNPWGTYDQQERCECGTKYQPLAVRDLKSKALAALAHRMNKAQSAFARPHATWVHALFIRP
jgi:SAM-dependent methyltransferase